MSPTVRGALAAARRWGTLGLALTSAHPLRAQTAHPDRLPEACYTLAGQSAAQAGTGPGAWVEIARLKDALAEIFRGSLTGPDRAMALDRLAALHPDATRAALAEIVVTARDFGIGMSYEAALQYSRLSGEGAPLVLALERSGDASRRVIALSAIRHLPREEDQRQVLSYACDAAWQLLAFKAEPRYAQVWRQTPEEMWPVEARDVIAYAHELLKGSRWEAVAGELVAHYVPPDIGFESQAPGRQE